MRLRDSKGYALKPDESLANKLVQTDWLQTWRYRAGRSLKDIALQYCGENPEARKQIISKAQPEYEGKPEIKDCILQEEERYAKMLRHGAKIVATLKPEELTGVKLCELHDTHGIDPCTVEELLGIELKSNVHDEYLAERAKIQAQSRAAQKKEVITVKGITLCQNITHSRL